MRFDSNLSRHPRVVGIVCAVGAVGLGLAYMAMAGAPIRYLAINAGALLAGLAIMGAGASFMPKAPSATGAMTLAAAIGLLVTALFGVQVEGVARWVSLGALAVQPSLVLLPVMIVGFAVSREALARSGMIVAAVALAIQPDRAMAGMLAASLTVMAVTRADRFVLPAFAAGGVGFAVTLLRADSLPAMPFVEQILYSSFSVSTSAGLAIWVGSALLIVPALTGWLRGAEGRHVYLVFGVAWLTAIVAAVLGNYPTPLVGYSGAAILGYLLSLAALPKVAREKPSTEVKPQEDTSSIDASDRLLSIGTAVRAPLLPA